MICSRGNDINNYSFGFIITLTAKDLSINVQWFVVNPNGLKASNICSVQVALVSHANKLKKQIKVENKSGGQHTLSK